jgi:hypothetical protein
VVGARADQFGQQRGKVFSHTSGLTLGIVACNMVDAYRGITDTCRLHLQVEGARQFCRLLAVFLLVSLRGEKNTSSINDSTHA